eukprot:GFYU01001250.1.p1 GENE.GFYU01001250.1~~GFYU01001250.1.p1  ORF type:complete len:458 (+),score=62.47 GFYU01001250.1:64-1437(+)
MVAAGNQIHASYVLELPAHLDKFKLLLHLSPNGNPEFAQDLTEADVESFSELSKSGTSLEGSWDEVENELVLQIPKVVCKYLKSSHKRDRDDDNDRTMNAEDEDEIQGTREREATVKVDILDGDVGLLRINMGKSFVDDGPYHCLVHETYLAITIPILVPAAKIRPDIESLPRAKGPVYELYCRTCSFHFCSVSETKALPSKYWTELSDLWACCCASTGFNHLPKEDFHAIPDVCLMGDSHVLVHHQNIAPNAIRSLDKGGALTTALCARCDAPVGLIENLDEVNMMTPHQEYHLYKCRVSTAEDATESLNTFQQYSLERLIAGDLLSLSQSHNVYRFALQAAETREYILKVVLMNWEAQYQTNAIERVREDLDEDAIVCSPSRYTRHGLAPALRLLYSRSQSDAETEEWLLQRSGESLQYPEDDINHIVLALDASREMIPSALHMFQNMQVGFLFQ